MFFHHPVGESVVLPVVGEDFAAARRAGHPPERLSPRRSDRAYAAVAQADLDTSDVGGRGQRRIALATLSLVGIGTGQESGYRTDAMSVPRDSEARVQRPDAARPPVGPQIAAVHILAVGAVGVLFGKQEGIGKPVRDAEKMGLPARVDY